MLPVKVGSRIYMPAAALSPLTIQPKTDETVNSRGFASKLRQTFASCDEIRTAAIEAAGFSFRLPPSETFDGSNVAPSVRLTSSIFSTARPTTTAPDPDGIRSIDYSRPEVSDDRHWATFVMTISTTLGDISSVEVRCQWADPIPPETVGSPFNCRSVILLDDGNTLEVVTSPRDGELSIVGDSLLASLRTIKMMEKGQGAL